MKIENELRIQQRGRGERERELNKQTVDLARELFRALCLDADYPALPVQWPLDDDFPLSAGSSFDCPRVLYRSDHQQAPFVESYTYSIVYTFRVLRDTHQHSATPSYSFETLLWKQSPPLLMTVFLEVKTC